MVNEYYPAESEDIRDNDLEPEDYEDELPEPVQWEPLTRLTKDLLGASRLLGIREARFLVDFYYQIQGVRISAGNRIRKSSEDGEPNGVLKWLFENSRVMEGDIKKSLVAFSDEFMVSRWCKSICGIGEVISSGLVAQYRIKLPPKYDKETEALIRPEMPVKHAAAFYAYAGLAPGVVWQKGQKRPWNARVRTLTAYKLGESFIKQQSREKDVYGKMYVERRAFEDRLNAQGSLKGEAERALREKKIGKTTNAYKCYSQGILPPDHLKSRARRWTVKLFLSHLHYVMYLDYYGVEPPAPYAFSEHCKSAHGHFIPVPNWPFTGGGRSLKELY